MICGNHGIVSMIRSPYLFPSPFYRKYNSMIGFRKILAPKLASATRLRARWCPSDKYPLRCAQLRRNRLVGPMPTTSRGPDDKSQTRSLAVFTPRWCPWVTNGNFIAASPYFLSVFHIRCSNKDMAWVLYILLWMGADIRF